VVVPYSTWYVVSAPPGFTVPAIAAPDSVIADATPVVAVGFTAAAAVVKVWSAPFVVPSTFVAT
jgi:hypothetical protein